VSAYSSNKIYIRKDYKFIFGYLVFSPLSSRTFFFCPYSSTIVKWISLEMVFGRFLAFFLTIWVCNAPEQSRHAFIVLSSDDGFCGLLAAGKCLQKKSIGGKLA
jgi:hypothetical protein